MTQKTKTMQFDQNIFEDIFTEDYYSIPLNLSNNNIYEQVEDNLRESDHASNSLLSEQHADSR